MRIHILVLDEVFDTGLSALLDTLRIANDLADTAGASSTRFDVSVVGVRRRVRTTQGLAVSVAPALTAAQPGVVLFPALGAKNPEPLQDALQRRDVKDAGALLSQWSANGVLVGGLHWNIRFGPHFVA